MTKSASSSFELGAMPLGAPMETVDEQLVRAPAETIFDIVSKVEQWPAHLAHYRYVRYREHRPDGGGLVEMSASRPFDLGLGGFARINWPTWWLSMMSVDAGALSIRFRHVGGITKGMEVEWSFDRRPEGTHVRIVHSWDGPRWPLIGVLAASTVIGPVFVHGIASRTLAGLAKVAERESRRTS
ncbi:MAG TPA: SRPBCC family protein [Gemmatimonadaceae bacterium]|nr:SRPBCC family protein [Gemmatimonadaceae bacterium]